MDESRYEKYDAADINPILAPCGGTKEYRTHMTADSGSPMEIVWSTIHPDERGNCTVFLNDGIDDDEFVPLQPLNIDKKKF